MRARSTTTGPASVGTPTVAATSVAELGVAGPVTARAGTLRGSTLRSCAPNCGVASAMTSVCQVSTGRSGRAHAVTNRTATSTGDEATPAI